MSTAATRLRSIIAAREDGAFLGGEPDVQTMLGVSRTTLRQIARLLEREGLLTVRRGANGGYYASRPSLSSIEAAVIAHLEILDVRRDELSTMASLIWIELVQQAASLRTPAARAMSRRLARTVEAVDGEVSHQALSAIEAGYRAEISSLIDSPYLKFVFRVNIAFAEKRFDYTREHAELGMLGATDVANWRQIKLLELEAITRGDVEIGALAARRTRQFWHSVSHLTTAAAT